MAHKKGMGSSRNGRESESKRLGVKLFGGQSAISGNIIVRQRGTKFHPGKNVGCGKDHTLFATTDGIVYFSRKKANKKYVDILDPEVYNKLMEAKKSDAGVSIEEVRLETKEEKPKAKKKAAPKKEAKEEKPKAEKKAAPKKETKEEKPKAEKKAAPKKEAKPKAEKKAAPKKEAKKEDKSEDKSEE